MAKPKSKDVFTLIKSLKASEKRYFKQMFQSGRQADKKYVLLFDALEQQQTYNEAQLLATNARLTPEQLPNLKAHLYSRILQSLRLYHKTTSSDLQIRELLDYARILFNKGLYKLCHSRLQNAKKLAHKYEHLEIQLEILKWEQYLLPHLIVKDYQNKVDTLIREATQITERINHINKLNLLNIELNTLYLKIGFVRDHQDFQTVSQRLAQRLPLREEQALLPSEKIALFQVYVGYYNFIQDHEKAYTYAQMWVDLLEEHEEFRLIRIESYIKALNYLMNAQERLFYYQDLQVTRKKLRSLWKKPPFPLQAHIQIKLFKYIYVHEFNRLFLLGEFRTGVQLMQKIRKDLEWFITKLDRHSQLILYYKIACLYFGDEDYKEAIIWVNKIINLPDIALREDVHNFARILHLVCHYELGNTDVLDHYIRSTYRYLLKHNDYHQFQRYILQFLRGLNKTPDIPLKERFCWLYDHLLPLEMHPFEKRAFTYFDILAWLQAKIQDRSVGDIVQEKVKKQM